MVALRAQRGPAGMPALVVDGAAKLIEPLTQFLVDRLTDIDDPLVDDANSLRRLARLGDVAGRF